MNTAQGNLEKHGYAVLEQLVSATVVQNLIDVLQRLPRTSAVRSRNGQSFARRNLLQVAEVHSLSQSETLLTVARSILGPDARPVRAILFDKNPGANWLVPWHQDLAIAVAGRIEVPGFGPWSLKAGVVHVRAPIEVLSGMLTLRVHLDDCFEAHGPLRVIPGSHRNILTPAEIDDVVRRGPVNNCVAPAGGAVMMRPLLVHASFPATDIRHRRVVHIEYAAAGLPGGLCAGTANNPNGRRPMPFTDDEFKKAMKAFRKKMNLTQLEEDSRLGRSPLTGSKSTIVSIQPPTGFGREMWEELANKGFIKYDGGGFYQMVPGK